jgi:hypothetical protein
LVDNAAKLFLDTLNRKARALEWLEENGGAVVYMPDSEDGSVWTVEPLRMNPAFHGEGSTLLEAVEDAMEANA